MKRLIIILIVATVFAPGGLSLRLRAADVEPEDAALLKRKAYDLYERGQFEQSADMFHNYVSAKPADAQAAFDYAALLARLNRNAEAADLLETVHRLDPKNESAYFKLGVQYVILHRAEQAGTVFAELQQSSNADIAKSASEAAARLKTDLEHEARAKAEQHVYDLAKEFKYEEVIAAVGELEKQGELSFAMALQRIYAYSNQQKYAPALELADPLSVKYPKATDLMLVRAELLTQLGRIPEAMALLEQVKRETPGSEDANTAEKRLESIMLQQAAAQGDKAAVATIAAQPAVSTGVAAPVAETAVATPSPTDESIIYNLAEKRQHREAVAAIDELEKKRGSLDWTMKMQRLYALQAVGDTARAAEEAGKMSVEKPDSVELAMMRADLLSQEHRWQEASVILKDVRAKNPNTSIAKEADRRLAAIPAVENEDKWNWGESYVSGDYHTRFESLIGYGYLRTGTYIPHARWLQPYLTFNFVVDSKSGAGARQTIISDNSVGFSGGVRAQLFPKEYLFLYVQGGWNKDLLGRRGGGDWRGDFQGGIYGYKAWGPGVNWKQTMTTNNADGTEASSTSLDPIWRGDWWVDAGADFSYYDRFRSWLGYGQVREGFRLVQFGNSASLDAYVMQNFAWDVKGNYTDNLFEFGPGLRLVYVPWNNWQVVLRTEWAEGVYFGRDDTHQRGNTASTYDDFRAGLSVGVSW